jgi:para-aminobenzoate synthetase/4-amino-4-deoxychorismate lyase
MTRPPDISILTHLGACVVETSFGGFIGVISAGTTAEIIPALKRVESAVRDGYHAVGFLSYEAATGLDAALSTKSPFDFPLLWFGIYQERSVLEMGAGTDAGKTDAHLLSPWFPTITENDYRKAVRRIRKYIAAGHTYQVNFTLRLKASFSGNPRALYRDLCQAQRARYCAFIDIGRYHILSASPELFFYLEKNELTVRPMKGTAARGRWPAEDLNSIRTLKQSEKERAENLMIVDLLRNDLGRISETGSVTVDSLCDVETLETLHQMTSTIRSRIRPDVGLVELLRALFPCGSVTGAPKKRSMEIISELEDSPRGLYTGCIGYISPGMEQVNFNVAIRTVVIDSATGSAELGVGSGITWDSRPEAEYEECLAKGLFAQGPPPRFSLLESMLFEQDKGLFLLERHLLRLSESARYFGFPVNICSIREALSVYSAKLAGTKKVRLSLSHSGVFLIESEELSERDESGIPLIALAATRVDSTNPFLYHKTSLREVYQREQAARPDCVDVFFINEREEVTEAANNNLVIRKRGDLVTPPLESGLLPGTFRGHLLETGEVREQVITREDMDLAEEVFLINSVRTWRRVRVDKGVIR